MNVVDLENALNCGLAAEAINSNLSCQTLLLMRYSSQGRRNSHSRNRIYPGRRLGCAVLFFNVNIFNFSLESSSSSFIFAPLLPILLSFLQIQSSGTSLSTFELRPVAFMFSVVCSVSYYFTLAAKFVFPGFACHFGVLMSLFGSLSSSTLIALTLRLPWWSVFFILLFIGGFFKLVNHLHATYATIRLPRTRTIRPQLPFYNVIFTH